MMMAMAAMSSLVSAGTAAVGAVTAGASAVGSALGITGAAGGVAAGAGKIGTALKVVQGVGSAFQAFSQFSASRADAAQLEQRAIEERMLGTEEAIAAQRQVTAINREFLDVSGQQRAAFSAGGIDLGSGSVRAARNQALDETNRQIGQTLSNSDLNQRRRRLRAQGFDKSAKQTRRAGLFGTFSTLASGAVDVFG